MAGKKSDRQRRILEELAGNPMLRVVALADKMGVTTETIRRDLGDLTDQGLIDRTYGGAILRRADEPVLSERHAAFVDERRAIATVAADLVRDGQTIMIGSGATTTEFAKRLAFARNKLIVIAHSFGVATALSFNPTHRTIMAPGDYHSGEGALHGGQTVAFLSRLSADWAVIGASALASAGPSEVLMEAGEVYSTMLGQSTRHMVVADHSKFDRMSTIRYAAWSDIDVLVTDQAPQGPLRRALDDHGVDVRIAPGSALR